MITTRREVVAFRGMSQEQQATFLATLWPSGLRSLYLRMLDPDESYEVDGSTARFPFPRAERRLYGYLALGLGATCLVPLAVAVLITAVPSWARLVLGLLGLGVAVPFAWVLGRLALLETTLEVTPFSVRLLGSARAASHSFLVSRSRSPAASPSATTSSWPQAAPPASASTSPASAPSTPCTSSGPTASSRPLTPRPMRRRGRRST